MNRRNFLKNGGIAALGTSLYTTSQASQWFANDNNLQNRVKNIIFLVSDGMSIGTLNMANLYAERVLGKTTQWMQLYQQNKVSRGLMDMASASSIVTDSAAASSSWGSGHRVKNGTLNVSPQQEFLTPIWEKFKKAGKKAGCVTTVPITHATPAGFMVNSKSRNDQAEIAEKYLEKGYDVLMGGGDKYFNAKHRKDKKDMYQSFRQANYHVVSSKNELMKLPNDKKILGVFDHDALPYQIDRQHNKEQANTIPTLAEMTQKAIDSMDNHADGFVLQVESGKVDWAAHANDIAGLIHEQLQFDEAVKVAINYAENRNDTLVIITTDHGNANPGVIYGKNADANFDSITNYKQTNEQFLNTIHEDWTTKQLIDYGQHQLGIVLDNEDATRVLRYYQGIEKEEGGLYNYRKLPFKSFAEIQQKTNSVGWISMDHSADYVEISMFGAGKEQLVPFIKNTDLHWFLLHVSGVQTNVALAK